MRLKHRRFSSTKEPRLVWRRSRVADSENELHSKGLAVAMLGEGSERQASWDSARGAYSNKTYTQLLCFPQKTFFVGNKTKNT